MMVQHWLDEDDDGVPGNTYEAVACPACTKVHFINRKTGKLLGRENDVSAKSSTPSLPGKR
jgi:hypothetical protein